MDRHVTRRDLLRAGGIALTTAVTVTATGCDLLSTKPKGEEAAAAGGPNPKEAPMLAKKVKAGNLPALDKRLPSDPLVVQPNERIGRYGGEMHLRLAGDAYSNAATVYSDAGYENLVRWDTVFKKIVPNVASSWQINSESTEYTFKLRKGLKWSDGKPFTADDVVFAVEDILMFPDITEVPPFGKMHAKKTDDATVVITFDEPNGLFVNYLATRRGSYLTDFPRHYLEQFHPKYSPDRDSAAKAAGFKDWKSVFDDVGGSWSFGRNLKKPTLNGWVLATTSDQTDRVIVERNPYYWKVDPKGSQLPYLDRIVYEVVKEDETALLKVLNGDIDTSTPELKDKPVVAKNRERGDYRLYDVVPEAMNVACIYPNLNHSDPVKRKIYSNKDFRIGLSYAINRREVINAVFQRQGEPWQVAPRKESVFYDEEMAKQYTEYDLTKANASLDKAFPKKNAKGVRLGPDGKPISIIIDVANIIPFWPDVLDMVAGYWNKVGIDAKLNTGNPEIIVKRGQANQHDFSVWAGEGGLDGVVLLNPYNYLPLLDPYSYFAVRWADWYITGGKTGEKPPADIQHQMDIYNQVKATSDPDKQVSLMKQVIAMAKDQFHAIGISMLPDGYGTISNKIGNWGKFTTEGAWVYMSPAPTNPCQYYVKA